MGLALVRLLTLTVLLACVVLAQQQPQEGQLDGSQTLFTVLAAINAAGYDANLDSNANSPVRKQVRDALAQKHLGSVEALKKFFADHQKDDPEAELSQYVSFALSLQGPPDFQFWMPSQELPPDVRKLDGLNELIALSTQSFTYFRSKGGFVEGTPDDLPPARREKYDHSGRNSKVLVKRLKGS